MYQRSFIVKIAVLNYPVFLYPKFSGKIQYVKNVTLDKDTILDGQIQSTRYHNLGNTNHSANNRSVLKQQ